MPTFALVGGGVLLHFGFTAAGVQPALAMGRFTLRPFDLPAFALVGYLWYRVRLQKGSRCGDGFAHLSRPNVGELLWATAAASLASLVGGPLGDPCRFLLLCFVPLSLLWRAFRIEPGDTARIAAVSATCCLGFVGLVRFDQLQYQQACLRLAMQEATVVSTNYSNLQQPVDLALQNWAHAEPQRLYNGRQAQLVKHLAQAREFSSRGDLRQLADAAQDLELLVVTHGTWSRKVFEAVAMRGAQWGDEEATKRAESRARSAHEESRLSHKRGLARLLALQTALVQALASCGDALSILFATVWALFLAGAMLGLAMLLGFGSRHGAGLGGSQVSPRTPGARVQEPAGEDTQPASDPLEEAPAQEPVDQADQPDQPDQPDQDDQDDQAEHEDQADTVDLPEEDEADLASLDPEGDALADDMAHIARAMTELGEHLQNEPVPEAAFDCLQVLKEAGRFLNSEKLLGSASALERMLKDGTGTCQVSEAATDLATVCERLVERGS